MTLWRIIITDCSTDLTKKLRSVVYNAMAGCSWDACELAVVMYKHTYHNSIIMEVNISRVKKNVIFVGKL